MKLQEEINRMKSIMGLHEQNEKNNPLNFLTDKSYMDFKNFNYNPEEKNKVSAKNISGYDVSKIEAKEKPIGQYPTSFMFKRGSEHMRRETRTTAILYEGFVYCMTVDSLGGYIIFKFNKNDFEQALKDNADTPNPVEYLREPENKEDVKNEGNEKFNKITQLINDASTKIKNEVSFDPNSAPKIELTSMEGKVFILDFWATWCQACKVGIKQLLNPLHQEFGGKGLEFFFYSLDENVVDLKNYISKNINYGVHAFDNKKWDSQALKTFNVTGLPSTFLFDKNGAMVSLPHNLEEAKTIINEFLNK